MRSAPIHRMGSLMKEVADLGSHLNHVCGCLDVVNALARQGQLTQAEEQTARAYLVLQEEPWANPKTIDAGAILYLDELSVSYLQHLGLLSKIQAAGFTGIISSSVVSQGDNFVRYESLTGSRRRRHRRYPARPERRYRKWKSGPCGGLQER